MVMDVFGRNPKNKNGEYFRANVWSWRPIHQLMCNLCNDLVNEKILSEMSCNDGAGPKSAKTCNLMANRFEEWLQKQTENEFEFPSDIFVDENGNFVSKEEIQKNPNMKVHSPYSVEKEHLQEWIIFLRNCGGFKVC